MKVKFKDGTTFVAQMVEERYADLSNDIDVKTPTNITTLTVIINCPNTTQLGTIVTDVLTLENRANITILTDDDKVVNVYDNVFIGDCNASKRYYDDTTTQIIMYINSVEL